MDIDAKEIPSAPGYQATRDGQIIGKRFGRPLRPCLSSCKSYWFVRTFLGGVPRNRTVHTLVAEAFHGPMPEGAELVRHMDGNSANNHYKNLAYGTYVDNAADRDRHGTTARGDRHVARAIPGFRAGERNGHSKLTAAQVADIWAAKGAGDDTLAVGARYGVSKSTIRDIWAGLRWRQVTGAAP